MNWIQSVDHECDEVYILWWKDLECEICWKLLKYVFLWRHEFIELYVKFKCWITGICWPWWNDEHSCDEIDLEEMNLDFEKNYEIF